MIVVPGDEMYLVPPLNGMHNSAWITVEQDLYKVFRVKGCKDAEIALTEFPQRADINAHGIWLGKDATKVAISNLATGNVIAEADVPGGVLSCDVSVLLLVTLPS